jgi:hypothetical protein
MKNYLQFHILSFVFSLFLLLPAPAYSFYANYYVKATATGTGDGSSWTNAFTNLQAAIDAASVGDTICVAAGTYFPTNRHKGDSLRHSTFYINKDIAVYGGFSGEPGTEGTLTGRDPKVHITTLSGDLGILGDTTDNAFHVVFIDHVSDTMRLDGFDIADGNNFGGVGLETYGAGIYVDAAAGRCNPVMANCTIRDNRGDQSGGGITFFAELGGISRPTLLNCHIIRNTSAGGGGIMGYVEGDGGMLYPMMINCFFQGNTARTAQGSAMSFIVHSATSVPQIINCVVTGNHSPTSSAVEMFLTGTGLAQPTVINSVFSGNNGGSFRVSSIGTVESNIEVRNSIFWNNGFGHGLTTSNAVANVTNSVMQNGFPGDGNLTDDPLFVELPSPQGTPHTDGDVHLLAGSPAIEAGDNGAVPVDIVVDADGLPRIVNINTGEPGGIVDLGAFEYQEAITSTKPIFKTLDWSVYPNPAHDIVTLLIPQSETKTLVTLWSILGTKLISREIPSGQNTVQIKTESLPEGVYVMTIESNGFADTQVVTIQ